MAGTNYKKGVKGWVRTWTPTKINKLVKLFEKWVEEDDEDLDHIFIWDFLKLVRKDIGRISAKRFYTLIKEHDELQRIFEYFQEKRKTVLLKGGAKKDYEKSIVGLILSVEQNYKEVKEEKVEHSIKGPQTFKIGDQEISFE